MLSGLTFCTLQMRVTTVPVSGVPEKVARGITKGQELPSFFFPPQHVRGGCHYSSHLADEGTEVQRCSDWAGSVVQAVR